MSKILFVNACTRENSRTLELANCVLSLLQGQIEQVNLYQIPLKPLDNHGLKARDEAACTKDFSNDMFNLARQFAAADTIVIAAPYWDLMFPSVLKTYFENVTVSGLTFVYGQNGIPSGLCNAKRLVYVTTSGGPIINNFGYDYVHALSKSFYGINCVNFVSAEGLDIRGANVNAIMKKVKDLIPTNLK